MRIAVLFRGISSDDTYRNGDNYRDTYRNNMDLLVAPLEAAGHVVDVAISTYEHKGMEEMKRAYGCTRARAFPDHWRLHSKLDCVVEGLEMLGGDGYDFFVITRFDLIMKKSVLDMGVDFGRPNFLFRGSAPLWKKSRRVCDAMFMYNSEHFDRFLAAFRRMQVSARRHRSMDNGHDLLRASGLKDEDVAFLCGGNMDSNPAVQPNPFYTESLSNSRAPRKSGLAVSQRKEA